MTISTLSRRAGPYAGNGVTTAFGFSFAVTAASDVVAAKTSAAGVETTLGLGVGYSVALNADQSNVPGGTVTVFVAPATGETILLGSSVPATQPLDIINAGGFYPKTVGDAFDRVTMLIQQALERLDRSISVSFGSTTALTPLPGIAARIGKFLAFDAAGNPTISSGTGGGDASLRTDLAATTGAALVGYAASETVAGALNSLRAASMAALRALPYAGRTTGSVANMTGYYTPGDAGAGMFVWDSALATADNGGTIINPTGNAGTGRWVRLWNGITAYPEWFGAIVNSAGAAATNDTALAACYAVAIKMQLGGADYWTSATLKANIENHSILGVSDRYTGVNSAVSRIVCTSGSATILQLGPDAYPGSINALPQGICVRDVYVTRSVPPVIASGGRGVLQRWVLNSTLENVKSDNSMIGIEASNVVHSFQINCESVRATAGTGGGTDYFIGNLANGASGLATPGGNASLFIYYCQANCNYGPLQTAVGSIGFKADQGFSDVKYVDPETTNFYIGQGLYGNDSAILSFSNTNFTIDHPIHDQFRNTGLYISDVATSGSAETHNPYFGPAAGARVCYWVNSSEGGVTVRGGQFVMGAAPAVQAMLQSNSRGCNILDFPVVLEHGNTYPVVALDIVKDARVEVFAKNPTVSAASIIQVTGANEALVLVPQASGKASAFQYGVQFVGTGVARSTVNVSGLNSACLVATNRKLDNNGAAITAAAVFATNCLAEGNFA